MSAQSHILHALHHTVRCRVLEAHDAVVGVPRTVLRGVAPTLHTSAPNAAFRTYRRLLQLPDLRSQALQEHRAE